MKSFHTLLALAAGLTLGASALAQTVSFTGATLTQNFDSMSSNGVATPSGWFVGPATGGNGPISKTNLLAGDGSASVTTNWNVGLTNTLDRALGSQAGTAGGGDLNIEARIRNNTIFGIDSVTVTYDGEQWRVNNNAAAQTLVMRYSEDGTNFVSMGAALTFTSPVTAGTTMLDGNQAANRVAGITGSFTLPAVVPPGGTLYIRWLDANDSGNDHLLAIDNFSFTAHTTVLPVAIAIASPTNGQTYPFSADVPVTTSASGSISNVGFYVDGTFVSTDAATPFTATIPTARLPEGSHSLQAFATNSSGVATPSAVVSIFITPNTPPSITISNDVTTTLVGTALTNVALLTDDVGVTNVQWFVDGVSRLNRGTPFTFVYNDSLAGTHTIQAIATDRGGLTANSGTLVLTVTNPPAIFDRLVTNGSSWKYYGNTSEPPVDGGARPWSAVGYDDSTWNTGMGELGNGDTANGYPETTLIDIGPAANVYRTIYFRKTFQVVDPLNYGGVVLRLLRDDGAVVHLNGVPVWTNNIVVTTSPIVYTNLAANPADDGTVYQVTSISPDNLFAGDNTVAVEIHQTAANSSDLSFDMMIWGEGVTAPMLTITAPTNSQSFIESSLITVNVNASTFVNTVTLRVDGSPYGTADTTRPFSIVASNLSVGAHTLIARGTDQFGAMGDSAPVTIFITANQPPVIAITNVFNGTNTSGVFLVGTCVTNQYGVSDDLGVTNVDFFVDGVLHYRKATAFGQVLLNDVLEGTHSLQAVATDRLGLSAASAVVMILVTNPPHTLLVTNGSAWTYNDSGLTQAVDWVTLAFDDSGWSNGLAELGFGDVAQDNPERTLIRRNSGLATNNLVYYFRKTFMVTDPAAFTNIIVNLLRDDGGRVYINGNPVFTSPTTFPPTAATADDGTVYFTGNVSPTNLVSGPNIVAVEVRQDTAGSSDVSFDLMLWGQGGGGPRVTIVLNLDGSVTLSWTGGGTLICTSDVSLPRTSWTDVVGATSPYTIAVGSLAAHQFYALRLP